MDKYPKPTYFKRQCTDKEAFIATHDIKSYNETFPIFKLEHYNKNYKKIFKENIIITNLEKS